MGINDHNRKERVMPRYWDDGGCEFEELHGKTIKAIKGGLGDDRMVFTTDDGIYTLFYDHD